MPSTDSSPLHPFLHHDVVSMLGDLVRLGDIAIGLAVMVAIGMVLVVRPCMPLGQRLRFVALVLATISVVFTEVGKLGGPVTWRLPVNSLFLAVTIYGLLLMRKESNDHNLRSISWPPLD